MIRQPRFESKSGREDRRWHTRARRNSELGRRRSEDLTNKAAIVAVCEKIDAHAIARSHLNQLLAWRSEIL
jgi:hypothetical protein